MHQGWIKICGIRDTETASSVAKLDPNAIGLNFYEKTPRCIDIDTATTIVRELPDNIEAIGLFVNHPVDEVASITDQTKISAVQLHGDESPAFLADLYSQRPQLKLIKAYRVGSNGLEPLSHFLDECGQLEVDLSACLLDARVDGAFGGTGKTIAWDFVSENYPFDEWPPLVLAGGLTPSNIAAAIETVQPWGVDVSSGVESSPAVKDIAQCKNLIDQARAAFEQHDQPKS